MFTVTVKDDHYNDLTFDFDALDETGTLLAMALDQGYKVIFERKKEPQQETEAV